MTAQQKFLFVLTSHGVLGDTDDRTGFHYQEMTDPYYILQDHGVEVDLASIQGGEPPADPGSLEDNPDDNPESVQRFRKDDKAMDKLKNTLKIDEVNVDEYAGIYLPGGHGTMWDLPDNKALQRALEKAYQDEKILAAVCHGPAGFVNIKDETGEPIIKNRRLNSFTNEEEEKVGKDDIVPFMLETALRDKGALFEQTGPFQAIVVEDSLLITGQNPPSASLVANGILRCMGISPYVQKGKAQATG